MKKYSDPKELAVALLPRSICAVQVSAVLADSWGVFAWSWNHAGSGFGEHAEVYCFRRANYSRIKDATMYVAAQRQRNGKPVVAKPCEACQRLVRVCKRVVYRNNDGLWKDM